MEQIPKFRYVSDVQKYLDQLRSEVRDLGQLVKIQQKVVAHLQKPKASILSSLETSARTGLALVGALRLTSKELKSARFEQFTISDGSEMTNKKVKQLLKKEVDLSLKKVVIPQVKKLQQQYGLAQELHEKYQTLDAVEAQVNMQFANARDVQTALTGVVQLKNEVKLQLQEVLGFLNSVANAHMPPSFKAYVEALAKVLETQVFFDSSKTFLYVHVSEKGSLVFTAYILLENAVDEEGNVTPGLYITVQWNQGTHDQEDPFVRIYLDNEFVLPQKLQNSSHGTDVQSVGSAVAALKDLLDMENYVSALGLIPLDTLLKVDPKGLSKNLFSVREYLQSVAIDSENNVLRFVFKRVQGVNKSGVEEFAKQLFVELKQILRKSRGTKIRQRAGRIGDNWVVDFTVQNVATGSQLNQYDLEFLRQRFGLTDTQIRKVSRIFMERE